MQMGITQDRGFTVAHQKVAIDVDLQDWSLAGWAELQVVPANANVRQVRLDCRQCVVHEVEINNQRAEFVHHDVLGSMRMGAESTVNQHHHYRGAISEVLSHNPSGELIIDIPEDIKIMPQDPLASTSVAGGSADNAFEPIVVRINYSLKNATDGVNFVGGVNNDSVKQAYWHAYTTHSPIGQAASSWMPCLDGLWGQCSWQVEITVPRTVRDIVQNTATATTTITTTTNENEDISLSDSERAELDREIVVLCMDAATKEEPHPTNSRKKTVYFDYFSPLPAHHVGFAVGAFVQTPVTDLKEAEDEEEVDSSVPVSLYTFPNMVNDAVNSCLFVYKAMEFFVRDYGAYPFTEFSYVFVTDAISSVSPCLGMAICSDKLLYPSHVIEPLFENIEVLTEALSSQWCGVNIVPREWKDLWVTVGISHFMTKCFVRKLLGNNEFRYRMRRQTEEVCKQDVNKPPIADPDFNFPITKKDLAFIELKAPAVLFILDRRMTKTDRSFGLSRVFQKLFLQANAQDLSNSCISTAQFMRLCERVSHNRLDSFFDQWVTGSGYPIFRITQRFNKKRMFVEMGIRQVQNQEIESGGLNQDQFVHDSKMEMDSGSRAEQRFPIQPIFTGPMTIRIHEADGTPYEHVVDLKENFTKLDIQYNTKYKRLKRNKNKANANATNVDAAATADYEEEEGTAGGASGGGGGDGVLLHSLGDVLQTDAEIERWKLTDWSKEEEDRMVNEAFEWIRVDADFEWICRLYINQPDYMFCSQLQQDRDVIAQMDAVQQFGRMRPSPLYSSILVRTLMDRRYFYGIRVEAATQLANVATEEVSFIGKYHLQTAFQSMYCFEDSTIPMGNDFSDFTNYFVQKTIPAALCRVRDKMGNCPLDVKNFLLDLLRYNDNSNNPFDDCFYVSLLIQSIVVSLQRSPDTSYVSPQVRQFVNKAVAEIDRCSRMDAWLPSVQNMITITAITQKESLVREGYLPPRFDELIQYTKLGNNSDVRLAAFHSLLSFGGLKNKQLLRYTFATAAHDFSSEVRCALITTLEQVVGLIAVKGEYSAQPEVHDRREIKARESIYGATELLRKSLEQSPALRRELWNATNDGAHYGAVQKRQLLDICQILYPAVDSYMVTLPTPRLRKLVVKHLGNGMMVIKRESRLKIVNGDKSPKKPKISIANGNSNSNTNSSNDKVKKPKIKLNLKVQK